MDRYATDSTQTQRLLALARAGAAEARDRLLDRHRSYLRQMVEVRIDPKLRARVDPSDVVQEAQIEALRRLDTYLKQAPMPFRLWLRQIAYDRLLMLRRHHVGAARRTINRDVSLPDGSSLRLAQQLLASGPTPSQHLVQGELIRRVHRALALLPESECEVLILRNLEGLSNQEVAQLLAIDPATASRRYGRAVIRLREVLLLGGFTESES
jgi:RNA polymerase sigma-70 factor (ECF subfamily)